MKPEKCFILNLGDPITVAQVTIESPFEDQDEVLKADSSTFPFENIPLLIEPTLVSYYIKIPNFFFNI